MDRGESEEINDWGQTDTECDNFEVMEVPPTIDNHSNSIHELKKNLEKKTESKTGDQTYRHVPQTPTKFKVFLHSKVWNKICPLKCSNKLRQPWTHYLYNQFKKKKSLLSPPLYIPACRSNREPEAYVWVLKNMCKMYIFNMPCKVFLHHEDQTSQTSNSYSFNCVPDWKHLTPKKRTTVQTCQ